MKTVELMLAAILFMPLAGIVMSLLFRSAGSIMKFVCFWVLLTGTADCYTGWQVLSGGPVSIWHDWLYLDALSAYHLMIMAMVFCLSSIYGLTYFDGAKGALSLRQSQRYGALWFASLGAMTLILVSNNLGMMWVGMETTTLVTAFLISINRGKAAVEGMWKYLIVCSVGIAFAFMGTLFIAASATKFHQSLASGSMLWTQFRQNAALLEPRLAQIGFLFIFVGFGTKAGLAPMHTWLPDAHSQAPSPVSALFSGFMLNSALYCIIRYAVILNLVPGNEHLSSELFLIFGTISVLISAVFIITQNDLKRLLAYSTVEHIGIISIGLGLGSAGMFAAMFHTLCHSLGKSLGFFSAGILGKVYGGYNMKHMKGALRATSMWGTALFTSLLALTGTAPFAFFISELIIFKALFRNNHTVVMTVLIFCCTVIFASMLHHGVRILFGTPDADAACCRKTRISERFLIVFIMSVILLLGVYVPESVKGVLESVVTIINGSGVNVFSH